MSTHTELPGRLAGSWLRTHSRSEGVAATVHDAEHSVVSDAVRDALELFVLGEQPVESPRVHGTDTGWVAEIDGLVVTADAHHVVVDATRGNLHLDPLVAASIARETARRLGADFAADEQVPEAEPLEHRDVVDRIRGHAVTFGHRTAVRLGDNSIDYAELVAAAESRADVLDQAHAGEHVVVRFDRSIDAVVDLLGVLVSGRAYLLQSARDDSGYASTAARFVSEHAEFGGDRVVRGTAAAYVQFTSGTTGTPKAIVVERAQLAAYCAFLEAERLCGPDITMPTLSAPEFDAIVKQIWGQLAAGGTVTLTETDDVLREIETATTVPDVAINTVPTVWRQFLDVATHLSIATPGTLLLGGEALDPELVERTRAVWPSVRIVNLYGPSECTSNAVWLREVDNGRDRTAIGDAIRGSGALVLDENFDPVPVGAVGSLFVTGDSVSRGYHGDPRRTAEVFLPADTAVPGARMYATGDRVRVTTDGLVYLGREDSQVKVSGVRVDLEALRSDLVGLDRVGGAVVLAGEGGVDVVVESPDESVLVAVRAHIAENWRRELAASRVRRVESIPRTATGKVDASTLATDVADRGEPSVQVQPTDAANPPHRVLEIIWGNVLGAENPRRATSISALGGDSMKQLKLIALYRRILKVDVSLEDFRQRDSLGDHEDLLLERVDRAHLDLVVGSLERTGR